MPPPFVRPFHFWCQKVLPLVFDDSLSYYEVLAKMRDYLNTAIQEINEIGSEFEGVQTQLKQLQTYVDEYFAELDVNQAISDKLDNMVESGEMDAVITPIFAAYANPLFAASVADMVATNFAYVNYENNKIYTFNQSTGLYQTTGKEFGGVVSSVDEMEDNDKYYALDSDGMLYNYDYPQAAFIATGLTYGGYRYGVNAMRPISNVYVLTTDSHVYTWNGTEYVDSGVVYGLSNTAFVWRRELSSGDNITLLTADGWYYFKNDSLPIGLPVNMEASDGFAVAYSIPNGTGDSRNKRIVLRTNKGGSWFWNGLTWIEQSESGYKVCENTNNVNQNSVLLCSSFTENMPNDETSGLVKTFFTNNRKTQLFFGSKTWVKRSDEWVKLLDETDYQALELLIQTFNNANANVIATLMFQTQSMLSYNKTLIENIRDEILQLYELTTTITEKELMTQKSNALLTQNGDNLTGNVRVQKTDGSLSMENVPADAAATGNAITQLIGALQLTDDRITGLSIALNQEISDSERKLNNSINATNANVENNAKDIRKLKAITTEVIAPIATQNNYEINGENNITIGIAALGIKTDETLTAKNIPADAYYTGLAIDELKAKLDNIKPVTINEATPNTTDVCICAQNYQSLFTQSNNILFGKRVEQAKRRYSFANSTVLLIGDSITWGWSGYGARQNQDDPLPITGVDGGETYRCVKTAFTWANMLSTSLNEIGTTCTNNGIGYGNYVNVTNYPNIINGIPSGYEHIIVALGTNDSDRGNLYARIAGGLASILCRADEVKSQVHVLTPIPRRDDVSNITTRLCVDTIRSVCYEFGVECYDLYNTLIERALLQDRTVQGYSDSIHPGNGLEREMFYAITSLLNIPINNAVITLP